MFNKSKFKTFVKNGTKNTLIMDKEQGWITDGYAIYCTNDIAAQDVLYEAFRKEDSVYIVQGKETESKMLNFNQIIETDYKDAPKITMTSFIEDDGKLLSRVFVDEDGENRLCQQKYLDILGDFKNYKYTQHRSVSPIYVWDGNDLVCLILPVKPNTRNFGVVKHSELNQMLNSNSIIQELKNKVKDLEKELKQLNPDPVIIPIESLKKSVDLDDLDDEECIPF